MKEGWVPVEWPENLDQMLEDMARSDELRVGWCLVCNSPIRSEDDFILNSNTHNCEAGRLFEAKHAQTDYAALRRPEC
jgi:hypothetical protein